jgi:alpha-glucosidase (family GH31 glycosyl hydrolase)
MRAGSFALTLALTLALTAPLASVSPARAAGAPGGAGPVVRAGELRAAAGAGGRLVVRRRGAVLLRELAGTGGGPLGRAWLRAGAERYRARGVRSLRRAGRGLRARLATTDPAADLLLAVAPGGDGVLRVRLRASPAARADAIGIGFGARRGERWLGFGERSNAVDQRGREVESRVADGPFRPADVDAIRSSIPPWGIGERPDSTYFPMPWLLSTRGFGALVEGFRTSRFRLAADGRQAWMVEADGAELDLRLLDGPRPAQVLRRLVARTGRQPPPVAPWQLGAWFQTGHANTEPGELGFVRALRAAGTPVSAAETHMRYMPCGADRGLEAAERARTAALHAHGLAVLTYTREAVCADDPVAYADGVRRRAFTQRRTAAGLEPNAYRAFVGGRTTEVAQIDFSARAGVAYHHDQLRRPVANGYDGWMEDYGEYTPPDAVSADGTPAAAMHNRYPVLYHRSGQAFADRGDRPLVRFVRSGWTGVHPYAPVVWGGDPTTVWGFDGLASAVKQGLTAGLSGIAWWGSDVGGFFTLGPGRLDAELLARWIQLGAVSGVMRTKAEGIGTALADRPQVWERPTLPLWRRYARLRTQLYPYLRAADRAYRRRGLPLMRHLALAWPQDRRAVAREDEFLVGPDLLAAPVLRPGERRRRLYLPRGRWVDVWRSVADRERAGGLSVGRARMLRGGRDVVLPAPLGELPLLARAGTLLPLLPGDVDTLAPYGGRGLVRLADRRDDLRLLAFPRGRSAARFDADGTLRSRERPGHWTLAVRARRARRIRLEASLATLARPFAPARVTLGGRPLAARAWSWDPRRRVLHARFATRPGRTATLAVLARGRR